MAKMTLQQRYFRYYTTALGYSPTPARTTKYIVLKSADGARFVFLGKSGAARTGTSASASESYGGSTLTLRRMELWEKDYYGS